MRIIATVLIGAAALMLSGQADAREYRFCAYYGFMGEDGTNCGFDTFQQCLDTISGIGGYCRENMSYQGPRAQAPRKPRVRKHYRHD